jgi:hypothetical protein
LIFDGRFSDPDFVTLSDVDKKCASTQKIFNSMSEPHQSNTLLTGLVNDPSQIPVPNSFTHCDTDMSTQYFEILEYVGFNGEASHSIVALIESSQTLSLNETVKSWIRYRWREVHANELLMAEVIPNRCRVTQAYEAIGIVGDFAAKCAKYIEWDPLRNIIDIMEESIKDALTLRKWYLKNKNKSGQTFGIDQKEKEGESL